jgi:hypothetical protein
MIGQAKTKSAASLAIAGIVFLAAGLAEARPDIRTMTCDRARQTVQKSGAVVMSTGQHTYERFVVSSNFCDAHQMTAPIRVKTKDSGNCALTYCKRRDRFF